MSSDDKKTTRIQFDLTPEAFSAFERLRETSGSTSRAELLRKALRLLDLYYDETRAGNEIQIADQGSAM